MGLCLVWLLMGMTRQGDAQLLYPFGASYFQDKYLSNPAVAGLSDHVLELNGGYRKESSAVPGSPDNQFLTGDYGLTDRVGLGINLYNDQAGLIRTTRIMGTYAYHVPLGSESQHLSFGISLGIQHSQINSSDISGADRDDPSLAKFNARGSRFDVDFGTAYTDDKLTLEAAFPGIATYFRHSDDDIVDRTETFIAAAYLFRFNPGKNAIGLEPRIAYRTVKGFDNVGDAGADISFMNNLFDVFGLYHTSKNASLGAGIHVLQKLNVLAVYTTAVPSLGTYASGDFEVSVGLELGRTTSGREKANHKP